VPAGNEEKRVSAWEQVRESATLMCKSTVDETVYSSCFAGKGDQTYLQWLLHAWGWTLTVALVALVIALVLGLVLVKVSRVDHG